MPRLCFFKIVFLFKWPTEFEFSWEDFRGQQPWLTLIEVLVVDLIMVPTGNEHF